MRTDCYIWFAGLLTACLAQTWTYQGCYLDSTANRTLKYTASNNNDAQTIEACTKICASKGYDWSGLEYGSECYCDHQLDSAIKEADSDCSMPCRGNSSQLCGAGNRLSVYTTGQNTYVPPSTNPGPSGWSLFGCYTDSPTARSLRYGQTISNGASAMTVAACTKACSNAGFALAGVEYGDECYCDSQIYNSGAKSTGCDMACAGNSSEICGGSNRLTVYQTTTLSIPGVPAGWTSLGCYTDSTSARTLSNGQAVTGGYTNMTIAGCLGACKTNGYSYAGLEYAQECFCGNSLGNAGACAADQSTCDMGCTGNRAENCGGSNRLNLFYGGSDKNLLACSSGGTPSGSSSISQVSSQTTSSATSSVPSSSNSAASTTASPTSLSQFSSVTSSSSTVLSSKTSSTTSATPTSTVCPDFWSAVVADLASNMRTNGQCNNISRAAIRYAFHDSAGYSSKTPFYLPAAGGADGSLLLSKTEINRVDQDGLRDYHAVLTSKFNQYKAAGYAIGAADLIQVAGAIGVLACPGGRTGFVRVGRQDTTQEAPDGLLPQAFGTGSDHNTIMQLFADKGFSARDLAALLGAHSTSIANFQASHGLPAGTPQDSTPALWDVEYYNQTYNPVRGMGSFDSDINLAANVSRSAVGYQFRSFIGSQAAWGASFASAYQALSLLGIPQSARTSMQDCTTLVNNAFA